jgi:hypothetical protein
MISTTFVFESNVVSKFLQLNENVGYYLSSEFRPLSDPSNIPSGTQSLNCWVFIGNDDPRSTRLREPGPKDIFKNRKNQCSHFDSVFVV